MQEMREDRGEESELKPQKIEHEKNQRESFWMRVRESVDDRRDSKEEGGVA
jgi:hypothetical protein